MLFNAVHNNLHSQHRHRPCDPAGRIIHQHARSVSRRVNISALRAFFVLRCYAAPPDVGRVSSFPRRRVRQGLDVGRLANGHGDIVADVSLWQILPRGHGDRHRAGSCRKLSQSGGAAGQTVRGDLRCGFHSLAIPLPLRWIGLACCRSIRTGPSRGLRCSCATHVGPSTGRRVSTIPRVFEVRLSCRCDKLIGIWPTQPMPDLSSQAPPAPRSIPMGHAVVPPRHSKSLLHSQIKARHRFSGAVHICVDRRAQIS